jgi:hypothetical protein
MAQSKHVVGQAASNCTNFYATKHHRQLLWQRDGDAE